MPYTNVPKGMWGKMDRCVEDVMKRQPELEKSNAVAICYSSILGMSDQPKQQLLSQYWISPEQMADLCPDCAELMRQRNIARVNLKALAANPEIFKKMDRNKLATLLQEISMQQLSEQIAFEGFTDGALGLGKPFRILPIGKYYRDDRELNITDQIAKEIALHFKAGLPRYGVNINVEHGDDPNQPGKIGQVVDVYYAPGDGVYAKPKYTPAGEKLLQEQRFDAVSPEIVWSLNEGAKYQDPQSGKWFDNVLVGLAVTTAPFFGREVSMFSVRQKKEKFMPTNDATGKLAKGAVGLPKEQPQVADGNGTPDQGTGKKKLKEKMAEMLHNMLDFISGSDDWEWDDSGDGAASGEDTGGEADAGMGTQKSSMSAKVPESNPETFVAIERLRAELKTEQAKSKKLEEDFHAEQLLRRRTEFSQIAKSERFNRIAVEPEQFGDLLMWLNDADTTQQKDKYAAVVHVLEVANNALQESSLFGAVANGTAGEEDVSLDPFTQKVEAIRVERFGDKPYSEGFKQAWQQAQSEYPKLARQYIVTHRNRAMGGD